MIFFLLACKTEDTTVDPYLGTITADRAGESADLDATAVFGYNNIENKALFFMASNPNATCEDVGDYLSTTGAMDPSDVLQGGRCSLTMKLEWPGGEVSYTDDKISATIVLGCAMGEGEWVYEERDTNDKDWYYSGSWWQGAPESFTIAASGGDGENFHVDIDMSTYSGNFIYESMDAAPASGVVQGGFDVTWCEDIGQATILKN